MTSSNNTAPKLPVCAAALALLPEWVFARKADAATGFEELVVRAAS